MSWLKLTKNKLYLMEGAGSLDDIDIRSFDTDTLELDVPLNWLRDRDAPGVMIVSLSDDTVIDRTTPHPEPWQPLYAGIDRNGSSIPHKGVSNSNVGGAEPLGEIVSYADVSFVKGKVSWFGTKEDDGVAADETGAITGEILRDLKEDDFFCAMRWSYEPNGKRFWVNQRILIVNPVNQKAAIARVVDWGPNVRTGRILDVSPKTLEVLGAETDDDLLCAFASEDAAIGSI
jgi:hypothetical protein